LNLRLKIEGELSLQQQIKIFRLSPAKKGRINKKLARKVITSSRKRIRQQTDIEGNRYAVRKVKKRGKMLRGLSKAMRVSSNEKQGLVDFSSVLAGRIARLQQEGLDEIVRKSEAVKRLKKNVEGDEPSTKQARRLQSSGFQRRKANGKGYVDASKPWIKKNLSSAQAGFLIRKLEGKKPKSSWVIKGTARSFLGVDQQDEKELTKIIVSEILKT